MCVLNAWVPIIVTYVITRVQMIECYTYIFHSSFSSFLFIFRVTIVLKSVRAVKLFGYFFHKYENKYSL